MNVLHEGFHKENESPTTVRLSELKPTPTKG
jgi:hypothetical protein